MKYLGNIYDGKWKVVKCEYYRNSRTRHYFLENIFNKQTLIVKDKSMKKISENKVSVSYLLHIYIKQNKENKDE